jgi:hypothetical protein
MRYLLALILLAAIPAFAAEINATAKLSWTVPATRENGAALAASEIAAYKVRWGTASGKTLSTYTVTGTSYDWSAPLTIGTNGTVTAYFSVAAVDTDGRESKRSPEASKTFALKDDSPPSPSVITVTVTCTAPAGFRCEVAP